ncbi:unnamed protein product [Calypogeia fissa]
MSFGGSQPPRSVDWLRTFSERSVPVSDMGSPYDIGHKNPSVEELSGWRRVSFTLNPTRRFRHVADLKKRAQLQQRQQFKIAGITTQAALRFVEGIRPRPEPSVQDASADLDAETLASFAERSDLSALRSHGGIKGICRKLKVDPKIGLQDNNCTKNRDEFGANTYPEKEPKGFLRFVLDAMQDLTLQILFFCAFISFGVGIATEGLKEGWYDGTGILFSIILVVLVTALSDYQQSLQFRDLDKEKKKIYIQVTRGGSRKKVSIFELVVGDIVHLSIGDQVPADGLLIEGYELTVDESTMTGESHPQHKTPEHKPFLLSGTKVQDGSGLMVVTGVGMRTEWGHLMATLGGDDDSETPLQVKLSGLATFIGKLGLGFALLTFLVLLGRFLFAKYTGEDPTWSGEDVVAIVNYFAIAVTIIVVAVPEGLPLAVTLTLAFAMKKMMHDKALVRHLAACETMGSATAICSDKTGTLTTNKMTVVKAWIAGRVGFVSSLKSHISQPVLDILYEHIFRNTSGDVGDPGEDGKPVLIGTPTETAVLGLAVELGGKFKPTCEHYAIVKMSPFNSKRKRMGVAVKHPDGLVRAHWKGAAEIVLEMCRSVVDVDGNVVDMTDEKREELNSVIGEFADNALRTLCLAYVDVQEHYHEHEIPDKNLVCMAIVGIKDPVRPGVPEAVKLCSSAGITVRMVTGDNIHTAKAIARECGILTEDGEAVEGPEFREWSDEEMTARIPKLQVMARSSPSDKLTLVKYLRKLGEVVAVTGDGTNDAPALHEADIGMAMGIAGTEVAKESADVIILDDNFGTIVVVAKWGRAVYNNIQKFVQFQLTVNLVALVINFVSACVTGKAPLTAVQLLWVNLIMDTLGALALATEPPRNDLLKKKAIGRKGNFISNIMWRNIIGQVIYQLIILGILQYKGIDILHLQGTEEEVEAQLNTMIFNAFVFCQVFNEINAREMEKLNVFANTLDNKVFLLIITFTVVFQWIMVSFLGKLANTVPLTSSQWLITVGIGAVSMIVAVIVKFIPVPEDKLVEIPIQTNGSYQALANGPPDGDNHV